MKNLSRTFGDRILLELSTQASGRISLEIKEEIQDPVFIPLSARLMRMLEALSK